jgi:hypothetical protein
MGSTRHIDVGSMWQAALLLQQNHTVWKIVYDRLIDHMPTDWMNTYYAIEHFLML